MKRKIFSVILISFTAMLLVGCNDPAPTAVLEPEGTEKIETEIILTEKIITEETTWDIVPTQTWD